MPKEIFNSKASSWNDFREKALEKLAESGQQYVMRDLEVFEKSWPDIQDFHVHIYFDSETHKAWALQLAERIEKEVPGAVLRKSTVGIVGPHSQNNIEVDIRKENLAEVATVLHGMGFYLSILLHPETGDDLKDHLESSVWYGKETPYNEKFFDALRAGRNLPPVKKTPLQPKP